MKPTTRRKVTEALRSAAAKQLTKRGARATAQAAREFHAGWRENPRVNGRAHPVSATQAHEIMSAAGVEQSPGAHSIPVGASVLYDMGKNRWSFEGPTDDVEYWLGLSTRENPAKRFPRSTTIQTLVFDADSFTPAQATSWAEAHDFKATKVDEKENTLRLRQAPPTAFVTSTFRTIPLDDGVQAVVGMPKKGA